MDQPDIIFFDGVCGLCQAVVQFVLRHDRRGRFVFCTLQSERARQLLPHIAVPLDTVYVRRGASGRVIDRSAAAVTILAGLGRGWRIVAALLWLVPRPLRNAGYDLIARRRYGWFGRSDVCMVPSKAQRERFICT